MIGFLFIHLFNFFFKIADKFGQTAHAVAARKGFTEVCKAFSDWELKQQEQKEKEKEKEVAASLPPLTEEEKKKLVSI